MTDAIIDEFIDKLTRFYGRAFTIVSGQDSYSFSKENHKNMVNHDGVYLLLENVPFEDMKHKYDKATLVPASSVNGMLPTNDPNLVKKGFSLSGSKLRVEMYRQTTKLFQARPILIREIVFAAPRKNFRLDKRDWAWLNKNSGELIFICTFRYGNTKRLVDVCRIPSGYIKFDEGQNSKVIPLDLDGIVLKRINDMGFTVSAKYGVLTNEQYAVKQAAPLMESLIDKSWECLHNVPVDYANQVKRFDDAMRGLVAQIPPEMKSEQTFRYQLKEGQEIKIIFPNDEYEIEVIGKITGVKRKDIHGSKNA